MASSDYPATEKAHTFAIFSHDRNRLNGAGWYNRVKGTWVHERGPACEYADAFYAHKRADDVRYPTEQMKILRDDEDFMVPKRALTLDESAKALAFGDVVQWADPAKGDPTRVGSPCVCGRTKSSLRSTSPI